jgi:hypothetical protein
VKAKDGSAITEQPPLQIPSGGVIARDIVGQWVVFLSDAWLMKLLESRNEDYEFLTQPPSLR